MRTDVKVGLVAVLVVVLLVITYFAFANHSHKNVSQGVLPTQQPGLMPVANSSASGGSIAAPTSAPSTDTATTSPAIAQTGSAVIPPAGTQTADTTQSTPGLVQVTPDNGAAANTAPGAAAGNSSASPASVANTGTNANSMPPLTSVNGTSGTSSSGVGVAVPDNSVNSAGTTGSAGSLNSGNSGAGASNGSSVSGTSSIVASHRRHHTTHHTTRHVTLSSRRYRVRRGDTLVRIAIHIYGSARMVKALERANPGLDPRRMRVGQIIHLPRASHDSHISLAARRHSHARGVSRHIAPHHGYTVHARIYIVRAGDSLRSIARRFYRTSAYWSLIYRANERQIGTNPNNIRVGEKIRIPAH